MRVVLPFFRNKKGSIFLSEFETYIPDIANLLCDGDSFAVDSFWLAPWQIARTKVLLDDLPTTRFLNRTPLPDAEYQMAYCDAFFPGKTAMCGLEHPNQKPLATQAAIFCQFGNFQAIPSQYYSKKQQRWKHNFNSTTKCYVTTYPELPTAFVVEIDSNDADCAFQKLWGDIRSYQLFDVHKHLPRPAMVVVNSRTLNPHFQYLMEWKSEDRRDPRRAIERYDATRGKFTLLFGGDTQFQNCGTRMPWYFVGNHNAYPKRKATKAHQINVADTPLFHYSIGYELKKWTLDELEAMIAVIEYHLGPEKVALAYSQDTFSDTLHNTVSQQKEPEQARTQSKKRKSSGGGPTFEEQLKYAAIPIDQVEEGIRDKYIFSVGALSARDLAAIFQASGNRRAFYEEIHANLTHVNARLRQPMTAGEVRKTARSVVDWCMDVFVPKNTGYTKTTYGKARAEKRWAGHLSIAKEAKLRGCSEWTVRKERKNGNDHVAHSGDVRFGNCSFYHQRIVYRDIRKAYSSKHAHLVPFDFKKKANVSHGIPYHKRHGEHLRPIMDISYDSSICEHQMIEDEKVRGPPW
jgi:hypothetical protein